MTVRGLTCDGRVVKRRIYAMPPLALRYARVSHGGPGPIAATPSTIDQRIYSLSFEDLRRVASRRLRRIAPGVLAPPPNDW